MTGTGEHASQPGDAGLVLVLNSGSSSVKFALVNPGSGQHVTDGLAERVRTPEAVLRTRRSPDDVVTERLEDGSYQAIIARILGDLPGAGLVGVGHRVVHGGERAAALLGRPLAGLRLVIAHLGNGCSAAAIRDGMSVYTTMGLTPLKGLAMAIAGLVVSLDRLDALVLTGGIGENSSVVRSLVLGRLGFLGLAEDQAANARHGRDAGGRVSHPGTTVALVVPTDEELLIARDTARLVATVATAGRDR